MTKIDSMIIETAGQRDLMLREADEQGEAEVALHTIPEEEKMSKVTTEEEKGHRVRMRI